MLWFKRKKEVKYKKRRRTKLGLVLSGGAGRGIGHIGVIKAFEDMGIEFDIVVGTSAGSSRIASFCPCWKNRLWRTRSVP